MANANERIVKIPREQIRPFPGQPREYFDQAALGDLARSIKAVGQQVPITVRAIENGGDKHDFELIDGQRRWLACGIAKVPTLKALVCDIADIEDQFLAAVVSNFAREGHSLLETAKAIARLRKRPEIAALPKMEQASRIADIFGRSTGWVYQLESLLRLIPAAQELMSRALPDDRRLSLPPALLLAQLPPEQQAKIIGEIKRRRWSDGRDRAMSMLIRRAVVDHTAKTGASPKFAQPARMRQRFMLNVHAVSEGAERLAELRPADFARMFHDAARSERESALFRIEACIRQLQQLHKTAARLLA